MMGTVTHDEQYKDFAIAVVGQAVADYFEYKYNAEHAKNDWKRDAAKYELKKVEEFFCSEKFTLFSDLDGRDILARLKVMPLKQPRRGRGSNKHVW